SRGLADHRAELFAIGVGGGKERMIDLVGRSELIACVYAETFLRKGPGIVAMPADLAIELPLEDPVLIEIFNAHDLIAAGIRSVGDVRDHAAYAHHRHGVRRTYEITVRFHEAVAQQWI